MIRTGPDERRWRSPHRAHRSDHPSGQEAFRGEKRPVPRHRGDDGPGPLIRLRTFRAHHAPLRTRPTSIPGVPPRSGEQSTTGGPARVPIWESKGRTDVGAPPGGRRCDLLPRSAPAETARASASVARAGGQAVPPLGRGTRTAAGLYRRWPSVPVPRARPRWTGSRTGAKERVPSSRTPETGSCGARNATTISTGPPSTLNVRGDPDV